MVLLKSENIHDFSMIPAGGLRFTWKRLYIQQVIIQSLHNGFINSLWHFIKSLGFFIFPELKTPTDYSAKQLA